jgi:hypothetical protein
MGALRMDRSTGLIDPTEGGSPKFPLAQLT